MKIIYQMLNWVLDQTNIISNIVYKSQFKQFNHTPFKSRRALEPFLLVELMHFADNFRISFKCLIDSVLFEICPNH